MRGIPRSDNMATQQVVTDWGLQQKQLLQDAPSQAIPPPITPSANLSVGLGSGFVRYTFTNASTGAAQALNITVPKAHKFRRLEVQQVVTSTGLADATGLNLILARRNKITGGDQVTLFSTNGSQAVDSVVFVGGDNWISDGVTYQVKWTGQNNDTLSIDLYLDFTL